MDYTKNWNKALEYIRSELSSQAFQTWFDSINMLSVNNDEITLEVPNRFHYEWLESKYRHLIDDAIKNIMGFPLVVNYTVLVSSKSTGEIPKFDENSEQKKA